MNEPSKQFLKELKALLKKYDATLELEEESRTWAGSTYTMNVWAYTKYDNDGNITKEEIDVNIGTYLDGD